MSSIKRLCFVCLGNIVRSPLAENMFLHLAQQAGVVDKYEVDSAGTGTWHVGESPDARMRQVAANHGLRYDGHARQFQQQDLERFDLILAMDNDNWSNLMALARTPAEQAKIHLLREFDPQGGKHVGVPDPYYGGINGFEDVFQIVARSTHGLLDALEAGDV